MLAKGHMPTLWAGRAGHPCLPHSAKLRSSLSRNVTQARMPSLQGLLLRGGLFRGPGSRSRCRLFRSGRGETKSFSNLCLYATGNAVV